MNGSLYASARTERLDVGGLPLEVTFARVGAETTPARCRFVLLHGNPAHIDHWRSNTPALRALGDVAALDLPGFGRSETPPDGVISLDRLADTALAVADTLHFDDFIAVGHSYGGGVAQTLAARHPDRVRGVVLIASIGTPANQSIRLAGLPGAELLSNLVASRLSRWPFRELGRSVAEVNARVNFAPDPVPIGFAEADFESIAARPEIQGNGVRANRCDPTRQLVAQARSIRAPVLMIHPVDDRVVPLQNARNLCAVLREAGVDVTFQTTPGGHAVHATHPDEVNGMIREWVEKRW